MSRRSRARKRERKKRLHRKLKAAVNPISGENVMALQLPTSSPRRPSTGQLIDEIQRRDAALAEIFEGKY
jgi:hypothetical protein